MGLKNSEDCFVTEGLIDFETKGFQKEYSFLKKLVSILVIKVMILFSHSYKESTKAGIL